MSENPKRIVLDGVECLTEDAKRDLLVETVKAHGLKVFVETGTFMGDTVARLHPHVWMTFSCELDRGRYDDACVRFADKANVALAHGNSGSWIRKVVRDLKVPALFWLDAHSSDARAPCPLRDELLALAPSTLDHVVLVDDARIFGMGLWPTLADIRTIMTGWKVELALDIVRICR